MKREKAKQDEKDRFTESDTEEWWKMQWQEAKYALLQGPVEAECLRKTKRKFSQTFCCTKNSNEFLKSHVCIRSSLAVTFMV